MRLRLCLGSLLAACALVAMGCGGATTSSGVQGEPISFEELARSASTSAAATSGRFSFDVSMTFPGADEPFALSGEGAFDVPARRSSITVDMSSFAKLLGGFASGFGGATAGNRPNFDDPAGWRIEVIQDGDVGYLRFPAFADQLPDGKTWVKGTEGDLGAGGFDFHELESFTRSDPREVLDALREVSGEVATVGSEELRGVETTHYRALVDPAELVRSRAGSTAAGQSLVDRLATQTGIGQVPVDVWIDASGLVHKLSLHVSATDTATSQSSSAAVSFELWDYGKTVGIEIPSASDVADASALHR